LGQVEDTDTGLTYLNARYYDPELLRFLSPDPLMDPGDPRTLDAYRYGENNPVAFTDASGLEAVCAHAALAGVLIPGCHDKESRAAQIGAAKKDLRDCVAQTGGPQCRAELAGLNSARNRPPLRRVKR